MKKRIVCTALVLVMLLGLLPIGTMAAAPYYEKVGALEAGGVAGWQEEYRPEACVLDGSSWNLRIVYEDGAEFVSGGSNAWPEGYDELWDGLLALFEEAGE